MQMVATHTTHWKQWKRPRLSNQNDFTDSMGVGYFQSKYK